MNQLGLCIARNRPVKCCWCDLAKYPHRVWRLFVCRWRHIWPVPSLHRVSADTPIIEGSTPETRGWHCGAENRNFSASLSAMELPSGCTHLYANLYDEGYIKWPVFLHNIAFTQWLLLSWSLAPLRVRINTQQFPATSWPLDWLLIMYSLSPHLLHTGNITQPYNFFPLTLMFTSNTWQKLPPSRGPLENILFP